MRTVFLALALVALAGCGSGDPEPVVGDNPAAANGRKATPPQPGGAPRGGKPDASSNPF